VRVRRYPTDRYFWRFDLGVRGIGRWAVSILAMKINFDQGGRAFVSLCSCLSLLRRGGNGWVEVKV
jgi:hypothetical protein